jgi:hypothetical protein
MAVDSPQAVLPHSIRSNHQLLRDQIVAQHLNILGPNIVVANGQVFDDKKGCAIRYIQNQSTQPCKIMIGDQATAANFHFVLPAASAVDAGDGGSIDVSRYVGIVTCFNAAGTIRLSTFEALSPESTIQN